MKKISIFLLVTALIFAMCSVNVFASNDLVGSDESCLHDHNEAIDLTVYPPCPNSSEHIGRGFMNLGPNGHLVYCRICTATIMSIDSHYWSVDNPTCTMGKYCILCNYQAPGQGALGHDVYPDQNNQYIAITPSLHGHVCERYGCLYNPQSYEYHYTEGYLVDEPSGPHMYFTQPYYESYAGTTDGLWRHKKYRDCSFCNYSQYLGWFFCAYNNPNCQGGCDNHS